MRACGSHQVYLSHTYFISGLENGGSKKGRRQRRKHWVFIRFHYKGCKGTKTKASTPEDRQGLAECALSRLPQPATGTHTHGPWDIHSRVYMLGWGWGAEPAWGQRDTGGVGLRPMSLHILEVPPSPLGGNFLGGHIRGQWTLAAKGLPPRARRGRPWQCPLVRVGKRSEVTDWASIAPKFQNLAPWDEVLGTGQEDGRQREPSAASITLTHNPCPSPRLGGALRPMGLSQ